MRARSSSDEASNSSCTSAVSSASRALERRDELVAALAGQRRHRDRARIDRLQARALPGFEPVELVEDFDRWHRLSADFGQHAAHGRHLDLAVRIRCVDDVHQQIGGRHFLERRAKCRDERVRKPIDEADRVRHEQLAPVRQPHFSDQRIQRHEERIRRDRLIAGQRVEERRLAGVGVADEGDSRHGALLAPLAQLRPAPADDVNLLRQHADAVPNPPAIGFEFGFARAPGADAAAETRQCGARSDESRQQVLQLRQLDLQLAFPRPRTTREDVEDELRPIDDLPVERLLEIAQLRRAQLVVEDDDVDAQLVAGRASALTLPLPRNVAGSGRGRSCSTRRTTVCPGGRREAGELVE